MGNLRILCLKAISSLQANGVEYTYRKVVKYFNRNKICAYMKNNSIEANGYAWQHNVVFKHRYKISVIVPLYNTPNKLLSEMIMSVQKQTYSEWELCLADGSDLSNKQVQITCEKFAASDSRIKYKRLTKNLGISGNTNECIKMASGEYIALFDHDDLLHPAALFENMLEIEKNDADFLYSDELVFTNNPKKPLLIHFKPDFAIDNLRSNNYICHLSVFKRTLLEQEEFFRSEYDGSQDYDIILRLTEKAKKIVHIKKVLYFWRSHPGSVASDISAKSYCLDAAKKALNDHLERKGLQGVAIDTVAISTYKINYEILGNPLVSVIIPFQQDFNDLYRGLKSLKKSQYKNFEVNIIFSQKIEDEKIERINDLNLNVKLIEFPGEYHYAKMCNYASENIKGKYIIFFDETQALLSKASMIELLMYAQRSDVGVVGSKLYDNKNKICHAGIVLGDKNTIVINGYGADKDDIGYMGKLSYAQNISAVLSSGMMIKKDSFHAIGKFDIELDEIMCGIKLSIMMLEKGYLNVFTPFSEFILHAAIEKECYRVKFNLDYEEKYYINSQYYIS